ncbi:uncharacterized protein LOC132739192 isoform X1 [Ruditapes philippinarum]|uniref:uncharacterized protein LOC132739192 isoform X1 n=1 Tax=Ruditapes philippinarum TaxID=129788 RepID=UPI00295A5D79|nr:uncharacterized protein LOC132739192 isoform X1 [Ruditapes philippinarum]
MHKTKKKALIKQHDSDLRAKDKCISELDEKVLQLQHELESKTNELQSMRKEIIQLSANLKTKDTADIKDILDSYNELYDTHHSHAFEELDKIIKDEKEIVMILKKMLFDAMQYIENEKEGKQFRIRQPTKESALEKYLKYLKSQDTKIATGYGAVRSYINKCFDVCWEIYENKDKLKIQSDNTTNRDIFSTEMYRAFTKTGKLIDYLVWPALLRIDGTSIVLKGVAQCQ